MLLFKRYEDIPYGTIFYGAVFGNVDRFIKTRYRKDNSEIYEAVNLNTGDITPFNWDCQILVEIPQETA